MKLIDLIEYLTSPEKLGRLYNELGVNESVEGLAIYMKDSLNLDSEVSIFGSEATGDRINVQKDGTEYVYVLDIGISIDFLESGVGLKGKVVTNLDKASRLLDYAIYDA